MLENFPKKLLWISLPILPIIINQARHGGFDWISQKGTSFNDVPCFGLFLTYLNTYIPFGPIWKNSAYSMTFHFRPSKPTYLPT